MMRLALILSFVSIGCWKTEVDPIGGEPACVESEDGQPLTKVDLLVLVDNSNSMAQEQASLTASFGPALERLTNPPDEDGDGVPDSPPLVDLHVGVISSDMGTAGYAVTTCNEPTNGDNGRLRHSASPMVEGCAEEYPEQLTWDGTNDPVAYSQDFRCIATLGINGCGFEQQLAAVRKSLEPGHNEGFLREDSLLAILIVTDEDDCSADPENVESPNLFNTQLDLGPVNLRCHSYPEYLVPIQRLVDDILAVRADHPERLLVAGITGVPADSECIGGEMSGEDFDCLLDDPRLQAVIDESAEGQGERVVPSCDVAEVGEAYPPRRILEFLRGIDAAGGTGMVQSICQTDWTGVMDEITVQLQRKFTCEQPE